MGFTFVFVLVNIFTVSMVVYVIYVYIRTLLFNICPYENETVRTHRKFLVSAIATTCPDFRRRRRNAVAFVRRTQSSMFSTHFNPVIFGDFSNKTILSPGYQKKKKNINKKKKSYYSRCHIIVLANQSEQFIFIVPTK